MGKKEGSAERIFAAKRAVVQLVNLPVAAWPYLQRTEPPIGRAMRTAVRIGAHAHFE